VRVALWRALHLELDAKPHILGDVIGLKLASPEENWRERPDMHPQGTAPFRASIVTRSRFIEIGCREIEAGNFSVCDFRSWARYICSKTE